MGISSMLASKGARRVSALSMLAEAAMALYRGNERVAALLAGAGALALRWSWVGILAELGIRVYQWRR